MLRKYMYIFTSLSVSISSRVACTIACINLSRREELSILYVSFSSSLLRFLQSKSMYMFYKACIRLKTRGHKSTIFNHTPLIHENYAFN